MIETTESSESRRMHGCLRPVLAIAAFWMSGVVVTLVLPLGDLPANAAERAYHRNAQEMRAYLNSNLVAGLLTSFLVVRTEVADLRQVQNSCDGGSDAAMPDYLNVVATMTDYGIWTIPVQRYSTSCAGLMITRGRPDYQPRSERRKLEARSTAAPPPPPPPPPGSRTR